MRLGAKNTVREELLETGIGAAMGIEGRVAGIANPVEARARNAHRLRQQRNFVLEDLQAAGGHLDAAEVEFIHERVGLGDE